MKKEKFIFPISLQMFAGGDGGDSGAAAESDGNSEVKEAIAALQAKRSNKSELANVKYGTNAEQLSDDGKEPEGTPEDRNKDFEKLIKGKYKDLYDAKVQSIVRDRLKNSKAAEADIKALEPMLELLGKKYGIDKGEKSSSEFAKAVSAAVENDNEMYSDEALELGISVEQLRKNKAAERSAMTMQNQLAELQREKAQRETFAKWYAEGEEVKQMYPGFDLNTELRNKDFFDIMRVPNMSVRTAYEIVHKDEIMPAAMQYTAKRVEENLAKKMAARQSRPAENGVSSNSPSLTKTDVTKLTRADRDEINRRVARGEKITFG